MPQAARFLREAKEPFETVVAHPRGGAAHSAGVKIKGGAHTDKNRRGEQMLVGVHPALLLRSAKTDPDDIRI